MFDSRADALYAGLMRHLFKALVPAAWIAAAPAVSAADPVIENSRPKHFPHRTAPARRPSPPETKWTTSFSTFGLPVNYRSNCSWMKWSSSMRAARIEGDETVRRGQLSSASVPSFRPAGIILYPLRRRASSPAPATSANSAPDGSGTKRISSSVKEN
jgi:hypothetical protein